MEKVNENSQQLKQMSETKQKDNESMRKLIFRKQIIDAIIIAVTFGAILSAAAFNFIDRNVTGTLFGTAIGYGLKNIRKPSKK